jgi:pimeloyl-ACP methyl ester carboxylesterase
VRFRLPTVCLVLACAAALSGFVARGADALSGRDPATLYRPFLAERATLSRDGRKVAYSAHEGRDLVIVVQTLDPAPSRVKISIEDGPYVGVDALEWVTPDRLVLATRTPVIHVIDIGKKSVRRVLDSALFEPWSADQPVPRPPRFLGQVAGQTNAVWIEGVSSMIADEQDPFSPLANPFAENEPNEATGEGTATRPRSGLGGLGGGGGPTRVQVAELVKLDLETGLWDSYASVTDRNDGTVLYDRTGHARIKRTGPATRHTYFHQYPETNFYERWEAFEQFLPAVAPLRFHLATDVALGERSFPLGFGPDPDLLYYASNVGTDTTGLFVLNLKSQASTCLVPAPEGFDLIGLDLARTPEPLIFDRATGKLAGVRHYERELRTTWLDPTLGEIDATVASKFPGRQVRILDWDDARGHVLIRVEASHDPGRLFVYHRAEGRMVEFLKLAPWINRQESHVTRPFDVTSPQGVRLTGRLTLPRVTVVEAPPLVVWLHDLPGERTPPGFHRDAQALADLGMIVLHLDAHGTTGLGRRHREPVGAEPLDQRVMDQCLQAIDWVGTQTRFDARRVAVIGEGVGGYVAMRLLALHPRRIRGAASINAPTHPDQVGQVSATRRQAEQRRMREARARFSEEMENWNGTGTPPRRPTPPHEPLDWTRESQMWFLAQGKRAESLQKDADRLDRPALFLHDPAHAAVAVEPVQSLVKALRKRNDSVDLKPLPADVHQPDLPIRIPLLVYLRDFLNDTFYRYKVDIGETKERD